MFQPLGKRVLIEEIIEQKKQGLLILKDESPKKFKVLAIGDEVKKVAIGDTIIIGAYTTTEFKFADQTYTFMQEENIIAKVK
jgi:co-chaperonin GroES (HSP10)